MQLNYDILRSPFQTDPQIQSPQIFYQGSDLEPKVDLEALPTRKQDYYSGRKKDLETSL